MHLLWKKHVSEANLYCKPTPVLLPGKSHERRSLVGWGRKELDTTERLKFFFF